LIILIVKLNYRLDMTKSDSEDLNKEQGEKTDQKADKTPWQEARCYSEP